MQVFLLLVYTILLPVDSQYDIAFVRKVNPRDRLVENREVSGLRL